MKVVEDRLEASLRFGVVDGDACEKAVLVNQIREAIEDLRRLRKEVRP